MVPSGCLTSINDRVKLGSEPSRLSCGRKSAVKDRYCQKFVRFCVIDCLAATDCSFAMLMTSSSEIGCVWAKATDTVNRQHTKNKGRNIVAIGIERRWNIWIREIAL